MCWCVILISLFCWSIHSQLLRSFPVSYRIRIRIKKTYDPEGNALIPEEHSPSWCHSIVPVLCCNNAGTPVCWTDDYILEALTEVRRPMQCLKASI